MAKIPGTHKHASIVSIPHSKEYKEGHEATFGDDATTSPLCQSMKTDGKALYCCGLEKYHKGEHAWKVAP